MLETKTEEGEKQNSGCREPIHISWSVKPNAEVRYLLNRNDVAWHARQGEMQKNFAGDSATSS